MMGMKPRDMGRNKRPYTDMSHLFRAGWGGFGERFFGRLGDGYQGVEAIFAPLRMTQK